MQPVQQPFQPVGQAMPGVDMGMPEQMPLFLQPEHHMPHSGHVLPATQVVFPVEYMPVVDATGRLAGWLFSVPHHNRLIERPIGKPAEDALMLPILHNVSSTEPRSSEWELCTSVNGKKYYYNKRTKFSSWEKPSELMTPLERADATTDWKEYTTAEGHRYYHNMMTMNSVWTIPAELKRARELAEMASSQQPNGNTETTGTPAGCTSVSGERSSVPSNSMVEIVVPITHDAVAVMSERFDRVVDLIHR